LDIVTKYIVDHFENHQLSENNLVEVCTNIKEELNSVKYGVGIYNRSESAVIHMKGKDVLDFLQRISTNDVLKLEPYHYVSTLFINEKGRLIDRTILVRTEDDYYLVGGKKNDAIIYRWLDRYIITEDVKIENKTGEHLILDVIGPQADSYLTLICGREVDDLDDNKMHEIIIDNTRSFLLKKTTASGENIYWIITEAKYAEELLNYLLSHRSVFDLSMVGEKAFDYYRVINSVPKYPNEINDNYNPHEAGLINDVSFNKGCYIGQEIVARLETYDKVQKKIRKIRIDGITKVEIPSAIYQNGNDLIGILTTLVKADANSHYEGLAFIKSAFQTKEEISNLKIDSIEDVKIKILD
jgi:folate-binding protein YgfZ